MSTRKQIAMVVTFVFGMVLVVGALSISPVQARDEDHDDYKYKKKWKKYDKKWGKHGKKGEKHDRKGHWWKRYAKKNLSDTTMKQMRSMKFEWKIKKVDLKGQIRKQRLRLLKAFHDEPVDRDQVNSLVAQLYKAREAYKKAKLRHYLDVLEILPENKARKMKHHILKRIMEKFNGNEDRDHGDHDNHWKRGKNHRDYDDNGNHYGNCKTKDRHEGDRKWDDDEEDEEHRWKGKHNRDEWKDEHESD
ncbi:MAG: hypothetical protein ABEJ65_01910 [bacterium]